jgi:class 3 adenylate cyclase
MCTGGLFSEAGFTKMQLVGGITHGEVYYGSIAGSSFRSTGIGPVVTLAFRLAQAAGPGMILMDSRSHALLKPGAFRTTVEPKNRRLKGCKPARYYRLEEFVARSSSEEGV